jgi:phosphoribosylaminoimidazole-succinocarboxamide synthase
VPLPPGLKNASKLPRADLHARRQGRVRRARREHQLRQVVEIVGPSWRSRSATSASHLPEAPRFALTKGMIIADTKFEFGLDDARHAGADGRGADARLLALLAGGRL